MSDCYSHMRNVARHLLPSPCLKFPLIGAIVGVLYTLVHSQSEWVTIMLSLTTQLLYILLFSLHLL